MRQRKAKGENKQKQPLKREDFPSEEAYLKALSKQIIETIKRTKQKIKETNEIIARTNMMFEGRGSCASCKYWDKCPFEDPFLNRVLYCPRFTNPEDKDKYLFASNDKQKRLERFDLN